MNRRIIWGILFVFSFLLFFSWLPVGVFMSSHAFFGGIGAVLTGFFLIQLFGDFRSWEEANSKDASHEWYHKFALFGGIFIAIVLFITFSMHYSTLEDNEIKKYGERVPATITSGYSKTSRKSSSYSLTVSFTTKKGKAMSVKRDVDRSQYDKAGIGQHVEVLYSKKHPTLVKILLGEDVIEEFTGLKSRDVTINDMCKLFTMRKDSILPTLNTVSYFWSPAPDETNMWVNNNRRLMVFIEPDVRIVYAEMAGDYDGFKKSVLSQGFKALSNEEDNKVHLFEKDSLILEVEMKEVEITREDMFPKKTMVATLAKK